MLVTLNEVLHTAQTEKYAVGLFNTVNLEMAHGVIEAAEQARSPVIIGTAEVLLPFAGMEELAPLLVAMAKKATVPVVLHFDHGLTEQAVYKAMDLGFSSVMYDCSALSYLENCKHVAKMVCDAHARGITVEAELGHVGQADAAEVKDIYTDPQQAADFCEKTGVDALAVAIGTAHGVYRRKPKLDLERLEQIGRAVDIPLVLHGGSGLPEHDLKACILKGIAKVNVFTDINCAQAQALARAYHTGCGMTDLMDVAVQAVKQVVLEKMEVFGSVGKA